MFAILRPAVVLTVLLSALLGLLYPLTVTGLAQALFPAAANGSLVLRDDQVVGSSLIGQAFAADRYFHSRPSATSGADPADPAKTVEAPYNAANSSGSNLGPTSSSLIEAIKARAAAFEDGRAPADLVTASASGLDPHISPAAAWVQVPRVASARGIPEQEIAAVVSRSIEGRTLGIIGEPRVNVLKLNLALDGQY
ncbi:potassium-transporting ATPase subunit KdpC [Blastochloris viridis]|uniref:Potassium-transporting ATPase KdpC subunit n=1 Tax=Blastochloris viridis TaxID=1079 RepID=A0A0H5BQ85_BLAVI|nr:potassium-transporting ATPase subunit KdpC [Blastochloris viridis]ALK09600.1 Potassium-transporting ATPase C chain [Blastochloris viridis]BAS00509.1 potassium-transporting ATPase C chain [Blastochloris viridis]CUU42263.1 potassium-transporting ATPase subunit C [Blastochloris viridis]